MAPYPEGRRWFQVPLSSARMPRSGLFSYSFQASLQRYQQLRARKRLRVGRPVPPPPPGLLEAEPPGSPEPGPSGPPPADSPRRASRRPRGTARARALRRSKRCSGPWRRRIRRVRAPGPAPPAASQQDATSQGSLPHRAPPDGSGDITVPPEGSPGGEAARSTGEHPLGTARGPVSPTDSDDSDLLPLPPLWLVGDESSSPVHHQQVVSPQPCAHSLDWEVWEERDLLAGFIPTVHPGEPVFRTRPAPGSAVEELMLRDSPARQEAPDRDGGLGVATPPLPILRWLCQLVTLCPATADASQVLREIWRSTGGEPWCPSLQDIGRAFARLGADLSPLRRRRLLPPELCPPDTGSQDLSCSPGPDVTATLALVMELRDICKFLALCVVTQPCHYADGACQALVTLLAFLSLDRALRCQPLPELQHLLRCLLDGIQAWPEQMPRLCLSLCQLSRHHHNLVALVRLLPDLTSRGRELRRHLSLHAMARLLKEPRGTVPRPGSPAELHVLGRLLAWAQPDALRGWVLTGGMEQPRDTEQEACYLSHSLLLLASSAVGTERPPAMQREHLEQLCAQLEQHFGRGLRDGPRPLLRRQLRGLAALLRLRWRELLGWAGAPVPVPQ